MSKPTDAFQGRMEEDVKELQFLRTVFYRPALLMCNRSETRVMERVARGLAWVVDKRERFSVPTSKLAKIMVSNSLRAGENCEVIEQAEIVRMGSEFSCNTEGSILPK